MDLVINLLGTMLIFGIITITCVQIFLKPLEDDLAEIKDHIASLRVETARIQWLLSLTAKERKEFIEKQQKFIDKQTRDAANITADWRMNLAREKRK